MSRHVLAPRHATRRWILSLPLGALAGPVPPDSDVDRPTGGGNSMVSNGSPSLV